ncbi:hypothetical protein Dxin01_00765 [Deinococcus xinjiangensis]|uniref:Uncharacterized protein n=1 Tax=Deinococcus xinjiangensis TaxID=457454 RepID=A0ABP9V6X6_9DEIO
MTIKRLSAGLMLAAGLSGAAQAASGVGIVSMIDSGVKLNASVYRNRGLIEVIDLDQLKTWRDNGCAVGAKVTATCPTYEYSIPFLADPTKPLRSSLDVSRDVAGVMKYEWQKFQDRTRWAISMDLNKSLSVISALAPVPYDTRALGCTPGLNLAGDAAIAMVRATAGSPKNIVQELADYKLSVPSGSTNSKFQLPSSLKYNVANDGVALPTYLFPRVDKSFYCNGKETPSLLLDSLYPVPSTVYLPNTAVYGFQGKGYPFPLKFNWGEVRSRIKNSCNQAVKTYYQEYLKNVTTALATKMPEAMHWNGYLQWSGKRSGTIFAPVANLLPNVTKVTKLTADSQTPQFASYLFGVPFVSNLVKNQNRVDGKLIQLEDLKRWLEAGTPTDAETQGSVNLFQTWQQLDVQVDRRPLLFYAHARYCTINGCVSIPVPIPMPDTAVSPAGCAVSPANGGAGTLSFTLPTAHFGWVSVPEGYPIPGLVGHPTLRLP